MQAQYIHDGKQVDFTPDVDVPVGSLVIQGDLVGVTKRDLKADTLGSIAVEGVFDFPERSGRRRNLHRRPKGLRDR